MAESNKEAKQEFIDMFGQVINGIDVRESTEWENRTKEVSKNIRNALYNKIKSLRSECDEKFLDYCNTVKSLLAIYNFGNLKQNSEDANLIVEGVTAILNHVEKYGYDITPYINSDEHRNIFAVEDGKKPEITMSVTTVFTTLVYFRRAFKRQKLTFKKEAVKGLFEEVTHAVAKILLLFVKYIEANRYVGWGFTFDSRSVRLSDTYAVVDAISRFQDAFTKDDDLKGDPEFIKDIVSYAKITLKEDALVERCLNSMYKAAFNVYDSAKGVYGRNVFYASAERGKDDTAHYVYSKTDYEQISNSSRSSALFNPLYVAMITMYGYNDKEIVIRRFMDDYELTKKYYARYESNVKADPQSDRMTLSHYSTILGGLKPVEEPEELSDDDKNDAKKVKEYEKQKKEYKEYIKKYDAAIQKFYDDLEAVKMLEAREKKWSDDYSDSKKWRERYDVARVFQKYLETQAPDELMKIAEYRDYFNATKDAIDQVQIMYRDFDNSQRLSVVDTDYVMFTSLDVKTSHSEYISKLNKANISVNNLRPMLLSSKIMIVNALTKYPQADLEELYNAIIASQYQTTVGKDERKREWLWNADGIDMNSTARHCEAITYDYFDYYERYELGLKALSNLKNNIGEAVSAGFDDTSGEFSVSRAMKSEEMRSFKHIVLAITHQNAEIIKSKYQNKLNEQELDIQKLKKEIEDLNKQHEIHIKELGEKHAKEIEAFAESRKIGDTMRSWIREETDRHFTEMLSMIILNWLNGASSEKNFTLENIFMSDSGKVYSAQFDEVADLAERIRAEYENDSCAATQKYDPVFKKAIAMQRLFNGAFDGIVEMVGLRDLAKQEGMLDEDEHLIDVNKAMESFYKSRKRERRENKDYAPEPVKEDDKNRERGNSNENNIL